MKLLEWLEVTGRDTQKSKTDSLAIDQHAFTGAASARSCACKHGEMDYRKAMMDQSTQCFSLAYRPQKYGNTDIPTASTKAWSVEPRIA